MIKNIKFRLEFGLFIIKFMNKFMNKIPSMSQNQNQTQLQLIENSFAINQKHIPHFSAVHMQKQSECLTVSETSFQKENQISIRQFHIQQEEDDYMGPKLGYFNYDIQILSPQSQKQKVTLTESEIQHEIKPIEVNKRIEVEKTNFKRITQLENILNIIKSNSSKNISLKASQALLQVEETQWNQENQLITPPNERSDLIYSSCHIRNPSGAQMQEFIVKESEPLPEQNVGNQKENKKLKTIQENNTFSMYSLLFDYSLDKLNAKNNNKKVNLKPVVLIKAARAKNQVAKKPTLLPLMAKYKIQIRIKQYILKPMKKHKKSQKKYKLKLKYDNFYKRLISIKSYESNHQMSASS